MREIRCRNCGAVREVPDHHGPMHFVCRHCEWQETLPPRRAIAKKLSKLAGAAFTARRQQLQEVAAALTRLDDLPPREFEELCGRLYERLGFVVERAPVGQDQSHAFELHKGDVRTLLACRRAGQRPIDVIDVENLSGAMRHAGVDTGVFVTTGTFADACGEIADGAGIELIDGETLHARLAQLDPAQLMEILGQPKSDPGGDC